MRIPDELFWKNKRVLVTGHTGFKGSWLAFWLHQMGAKVSGVALNPPTQPNMFDALKIDQLCSSHICDIRDLKNLRDIFFKEDPEIVLHLAAQPLVRYSYDNPLETYEVNVQGTAHILEICRSLKSLKSLVLITTDKCYENKEWVWGYRENDPMGGYDPYSSSKGCAEILISSYRRSFFGNPPHQPMKIGVASARAGNVLGGGDWALDRIIPDAVRCFSTQKSLQIRNPKSTRPWQHVLEPLNGYLCLAEDAYQNPNSFSEGYNFGPYDDGCVPVDQIIRMAQKHWGSPTEVDLAKGPQPHEAQFLKLDISKARQKLNWTPIWNIEETLKFTIEWYREFVKKSSEVAFLRELTSQQIRSFTSKVGISGEQNTK